MNGKKWFKIMVNILLIEINSLLNYSWINHIFTRMEIKYESSQYIYIYYICIYILVVQYISVCVLVLYLFYDSDGVKKTDDTIYKLISWGKNP